jgi:N-acetyltransferase
MGWCQGESGDFESDKSSESSESDIRHQLALLRCTTDKLTRVQLNDILCMVDTVLSAPALPRTILDNCKVFLLVTASPPLPTTASGQRKRTRLSGVKGGATPRERIVGVVVAQRIRWAMRVLRDSDSEQREGLKIVDTGGGVICE